MLKIILSIVAVVTFSQSKCNRETTPGQCYKGRLEIKGICSNYTIALVEGKLDSTQLEASWTNESTGKTYKNVFALGSPCDFPSTLKEGDEFYFTLAASPQNCAVCQAYYPHPSKSLAIKVVNKPCGE